MEGGKLFFAFLRFSQNHACGGGSKEEGEGERIYPLFLLLKPRFRPFDSRPREELFSNSFSFAFEKKTEERGGGGKKPAADVFEIGRNWGKIRQ